MPRITIRQIPEFLARYNYHDQEDDDLISRRARIQREGKMRLEDLCLLCQWKAPRAAGHALKNKNAEVEEITGLAFRARNERVRIEVLQTLYGINYPTASVILHFFHKNTYPILDFRALWSMRIPQPATYTFSFWWDYVDACRRLLHQARRHHPKLSIRELDRGLWQYSYERQR
jgi:hypothetical protein